MNIKMLFEKSMWKLLEKKSINNISLGMLIEDVGSCKGTFYKYFMDKYDLCNTCLQNNVYEVLKPYTHDFDKYCTECISLFEKYSNILRHAFDSEEVDSARNMHERKTAEVLNAVIPDTADESLREVCITRYAASCTGIISEWLDGGEISATECMDRIRAIIPHYIYDAVYGSADRREKYDRNGGQK